MPRLEAHCITYNESAILPYWLRHYRTLTDRLIVHDSGSTDDTREIAQAAGAEVRPWDSGNEVNEILMVKQKQEGWLGTDSDWVVFTDADELIHFPVGLDATLSAYERAGIPIAKPHGFNMVSDQYPTTPGQVYDEIKYGGRDDRWYGKPALFNPRLIKDLTYEMGAHECCANLKNGLHILSPRMATEPPVYMLHFKHIDSVENIGRKYDAYAARFSKINLENKWGNHEPGPKHATDQRNQIKLTLQRVMP